MPKPWSKTEIGYTRHPKFLALNANAFALWHEAKDFCEMHHTDGLIPREAVKTFRFGAKRSVEMLLSVVEKADGTTYAPLWEVHPVGFKMHDYLDHNDSREVVLARLEQAERDRQLDRGYKAKARAAKKAKREARPGERPAGHPGECPADVRLYTETTTKEVSKEQKPPGTPVGRFLALYEQLFEKAHGSKPVILKRDPDIANQLIRKVGEERALSLLRAFFESDDHWIQDKGHGLNIFTSQVNSLLSNQKAKSQTPVETPEEYLERIGWCSHTPKCTESEACRALRAAAKVST